MTATPKTPPPGGAMVAFDPALLERAKALAGRVDQRVSVGGGFTVYEINRLRGGYKETSTGAQKDEILMVPLLLRETRSMWLREGTGDPPDCRSINGIEPVDDREGPDDHVNPAPVSPEGCAKCPWDQFGTGKDGRGKKCKTRGILFGVEVAPDGSPIRPVVLRISLSNRAANASLRAADERCRELNVPRFLTIWRVTTHVEEAKKKGQQDYTHFAAEVVGTCRPQDAERFIKESEGLVEAGADNFLRTTPDRGE